MSSKSIQVNLRTKLLKDKRLSYYLHFYNPATRKRRKEYLGLYLFSKPKDEFQKEHNSEINRLANSIYAKKVLEIQEGKFGFIPKHKLEITLLSYFESLLEKKQLTTSESNFSNWKSTFKHLRHFTRDDLKLTDIDEEWITSFREFLLTENLNRSVRKLSQNAASSYFNKFKAAMNEAYNNKMILDNPSTRVKSIKPGETKREFLTEDEIKLLFQADCRDPRIKKVFLFGILTGMRFSDTTQLLWSDLQYSSESGWFVRFKQQKTKNHETLPLNDQVIDLLGDKGLDDERIFKGVKYSAHNNHILLSWVKDAGIKKHITFHSSRHTHACLLLDKGVDIYTVSKMLGHREVKTTSIYLKVLDKNKAKAASLLPSFSS
ncbi:MAG: site-specific integrase [Cyclobacteriaceae bacterium]